jgi:hypothetical protein
VLVEIFYAIGVAIGGICFGDERHVFVVYCGRLSGSYTQSSACALSTKNVYNQEITGKLTPELGALGA